MLRLAVGHAVLRAARLATLSSALNPRALKYEIRTCEGKGLLECRANPWQFASKRSNLACFSTHRS